MKQIHYLGAVPGKEAPKVVRLLIKLSGLLKLVITYLSPVMLAYLVDTPKHNREHRALFVILLVGIHWLLASVPPVMVSLMPLIYIPLLELLTAAEVAETYMTNFIFSGFSMMIFAATAEYCGIAKFVAVRLLRLFIRRAHYIVFGVMMTGFLMSMWLSDTYSAVFMTEIVNELFLNLQRCQHRKLPEHDKGGDEDMSRTTRDIQNEIVEECWKLEHKRRVSLIGLVFATTCGNMALIHSSFNNYFLEGIIKTRYKYNRISCLTWAIVHFPMCVVLVFMAWGILYHVQLGRKVIPNDVEKANTELRDILNEMCSGKLAFTEIAFSSIYVTLLVLLYTHTPALFNGWEQSISLEHTAPIWLTAVLFLFVFPTSPKAFVEKQSSRIASWPTVQNRIAWPIIFIMSASWCLNQLYQQSGLQYLGYRYIREFEYPEPIKTQLFFVFIASLVSELCHRNIVLGLTIPYVTYVADAMHVHPLYFALPVHHAASFAFVYRVGSEIIAKDAQLRFREFVIPGLFMKIASISFSLLMVNSFGFAVLQMRWLPFMKLGNDNNQQLTQD